MKRLRKIGDGIALDLTPTNQHNRNGPDMIITRSSRETERAPIIGYKIKMQRSSRNRAAGGGKRQRTPKAAIYPKP
jgi:hypothetical protein